MVSKQVKDAGLHSTASKKGSSPYKGKKVKNQNCHWTWKSTEDMPQVVGTGVWDSEKSAGCDRSGLVQVLLDKAVTEEVHHALTLGYYSRFFVVLKKLCN